MAWIKDILNEILRFGQTYTPTKRSTVDIAVNPSDFALDIFSYTPPNWILSKIYSFWSLHTEAPRAISVRNYCLVKCSFSERIIIYMIFINGHTHHLYRFGIVEPKENVEAPLCMALLKIFVSNLLRDARLYKHVKCLANSEVKQKVRHIAGLYIERFPQRVY